MASCVYCGDPAARVGDVQNETTRTVLLGLFGSLQPRRALRFRGNVCCLECFLELRCGQISQQPVQFFFGGTGRAEDDGGPWQQNAVRDWEDAK